MKQLGALTLAMARGFLRDRMTLFWSVAFPLMFLVVFGGIFTDRGAPRYEVLQVGEVSLIDQMPADARAGLDEVVDLTEASSRAAAIAKVKSGDVAAAISQQGDRLVVLYSAADQVQAAQVQAVFAGLVDAGNAAVSGVTPRWSLQAQQVEDDSLKTIQYVTPGLLGWAVAMSATFGASVNLVAWRKSGLLRRLRLAPTPTSSVVLARVGVSIAVAIAQAVIFIGLAVAAFGLQLTGSWPLVIPVLVVGTLAFLSIGLLAGSITATEEAAVGLANIVVLPMAFLSGSFFPLDGAPGWLQFVSRLLPLRHLTDAMLDVMVRGQGVEAIWVPMGVLAGFTVVLTAVALRFFRWDA